MVDARKVDKREEGNNNAPQSKIGREILRAGHENFIAGFDAAGLFKIDQQTRIDDADEAIAQIQRHALEAEYRCADALFGHVVQVV